MKKVLLLTTGGTIAARKESRDILNLDSSNIQPEEWQYITEILPEMLPLYDGIIIAHGTDTLAYTA